MKGYKVFNSDWTCRDFQYKVGETYIYDGVIEICGSGFHFCKKIVDCFNYYGFDCNNKVAEVEALGNIVEREDKLVTDKIRVVKELSWYEVLDMCNTGNCNTGKCNTGNWNTGNYNTGKCNTGNWNTGDWNIGNYNTGKCNTGNRNTGNRNTGNCNTGNCNTGNCNTGNCNTGNRNTGDYNTGNCNTGNCNTGNWNTGDWNIGDYNTGNRNTGNCNTGNWNRTNRSTGFFNTVEQPIIIFNKPTTLSYNEIISLRGMKILNHNFYLTEWVCEYDMTDKEKEENPTYKTTGGYLKKHTYFEACKNMWNKLDDEEKQAVKDLPNFDAEIFKEIAGIDVEE